MSPEIDFKKKNSINFNCFMKYVFESQTAFSKVQEYLFNQRPEKKKSNDA